jgi:molybdopterin synthase sulfur carrier subunit
MTRMPVTVKIPTILRQHVGGMSTVEARGETVGELLENLESEYPGLTGGIVTDDGGIHRFVNLYVNQEDARYLGSLAAKVRDGDTVSILPSVAGGGSLQV